MINTMNIYPFAGAYQPVWQNKLFCHTNNVIRSVVVFNAKVQSNLTNIYLYARGIF
jgi:hypothetical protein